MTDRLLGKAPQGPEGDGAPGTAPEGQGRLVGRRYRLMSPVGRGGMGMVWHAHDVLLDRDVAVKELILPYGMDHAGKQVAHQRMLREARSAARLSHPGIVTVHDVVEEDGRPWIVMELVRAWSLEQAVRQSGPLPVVQTAEIGVRVLDALRHAHAAGIMHRDVKPGNVLLTSDRVILTDFGIAAIEGDSTITQAGMLMGSPAYIPPERLSGQRITQAADLWSFGATLYAAVEGRPPYEGSDSMAVLGAILTQEPTRPQRAGALVAVLEGLLRKNPADRMSAAQVSDLLDRILLSHGSSTPNRARPPHPPAMPPPGEPVPMHMMPPLESPSGPMPSRIIETPSGPVRVPYDPAAGSSGGYPMPYDALSSPSGTHRTDQLAAPHPSVYSAPPMGGPPNDVSSPSGGHQRGYDALRIPTAGLERNAPDAPSDFSDGFPGSGLWPTAAPSAPARRDSAQDSQSLTSPGRSGDRRSRRLTNDGGRNRGGRPRLRLLLLGGVGVLAVLVIALLVFLPGDDATDTAATTVPSPASSASAGAEPPSEEPGEVPDGFKALDAGGISGAVPEGWTVKTGTGGAIVFSEPKTGGQNVVVTKVPVADPVTALGRADKEGLEEYIEVGVTAVPYRGWKAADWEYTYSQSNGVPMHGLTRYVAVSGQTAYEITFRAQDLEWEKSSDVLDTFFSTFTLTG
ncbi:serine/threonine-protein kinase [Streptosporangium subroseum]|uniref:serine/threonine-protein kinase n=1 Tax=Streptosporangium subroseum TaxID=106412 RepID=UPI003090110B|nr:protein kinase [Streptosporangium subroseum]